MAGFAPAIRIFAKPERNEARLRSCGMNPASDKLRDKRARRHVSDRLREYYNSMKTMLEDDAERFFEQVMQQAREQRQLQHGTD
jgi:hypothetical protein